jgi:hypothetical protein
VNGAVDKWLYLLNHAKDGNELPNFGSEIIEDAIERIKVANAPDELLAAQEKYMTTKEDYESWAAGLVIHAREDAMAEGLEKGREKERVENQADTEAVLRDMGIAQDKIVEMQARLEALRQSRLAQK